MPRTRINQCTISTLPAPTRLDRYCASRFTYLTVEQWDAEIQAGRVLLEGLPVFDPARLVHGGERLLWDAGNLKEPEVDGAYAVVHEDARLLVIDKPGNLPVHPAGRYFNNTLTAMLEARYGRPVYPVHRIDRETSGAILLTFDRGDVQALAASMAAKEYLAIVHGEFPVGEMRIDWPLGPDRDSTVKKKRKAWPGGAEQAATRFIKVLAIGGDSLVRCFPETGRLHQIRAHLHAAGYPIVGDKLYGRDERAFLDFVKHGWTPELAERLVLPRGALHAAGFSFIHPESRKTIIVRTPLPAMFCEYMRSRGIDPGLVTG